ncbi:hypothetical protein WS57_14530 [Burkholderia pseudomultivorans]|nr:hypothetical protein WS57_14530 [Burkholderia pseudomultivorans]
MAAVAELTDTISVAADAISTNFELQHQHRRVDLVAKSAAGIVGRAQDAREALALRECTEQRMLQTGNCTDCTEQDDAGTDLEYA